MSENPTPGFTPAALFRRALFVALLLGLTFLYLGLQFRGLDNPRVLEQADTAREMARGNGFTSKVLYPIAIKKAESLDSGISAIDAAGHQTFHSPLNPFILSVAMRVAGVGENDEPDEWKMSVTDKVYKLDRIVAAISTLFFLVAIGLSYLLAARIFDAKIGSVVALLMLLSDLFWQYSLSGLPQMLMLVLFTAALINAYAATENSKLGRPSTLNALLAAFFFALLPITHWLATWLVLGYIIYAIIFIRPRGLAGIATIILTLAFSATFLVLNMKFTGSPTGTSLYVLYDKLAGAQETVYRSTEIPYIDITRLFLDTVSSSFSQIGSLIPNMGGILAAPLFFLALCHPFKKDSIASFRWGILICWLCAVFGMSMFGLDDESAVHSNQIHLLFAPIMAAYGLAFLSILWAKVKLPNDFPLASSLHFVVIILLSAGSLLIDLPNNITTSLGRLRSQAPPSLPFALNTRLAELVDEKSIVASDQPWAVAWYGDRKSIWLPYSREDLLYFEGEADDQKNPITAILLTPYSTAKNVGQTYGRYRDYSSLLLDGWTAIALQQRNPKIISNQDPKLKGLLSRYPDSEFLGDYLTILHYQKK